MGDFPAERAIGRRLAGWGLAGSEQPGVRRCDAGRCLVDMGLGEDALAQEGGQRGAQDHGMARNRHAPHLPAHMAEQEREPAQSRSPGD